jgi:GNAT superfamily N-acetyltransferase
VEAPADRSRLVADLIDALPDWFGIPDANRHYVAGAASRRAFGAFDGPDCRGLVVVEPLFGRAMELWWLGVQPGLHRQGIGQALVEAAEAEAGRLGLPLMAVRTLSAADPDPGYARTRAFYEALGYRATLPAGDGSPLVWMLKER